MTITLSEPSHGKNYRVEIFAPLGNLNQYCYRGQLMFGNEAVKRAHTFLQCEDTNYLMFEFWTDDQEKILAAALEIENFFTK